MTNSDKPNIIFVVIDAARADHFSCYGYQRETTPNIDKLAKESTLYENAISAAGWTLPSHTSMFTGMYPSKHGVHNENHVYDGKYPTMAEVLKSEGYDTVGFCTNDWISDATGLTRGFKEFYDFHYGKIKHKSIRLMNYLRVNGKDSWSHAINRRVRDWLKDHDRSNPYFMFIHYGELHLPYQIPSPYNTRFLPKGMTYEDAQRVNQDPKAYYAGVTNMKEDDFQLSSDLYDCALAYQDAELGRFVEFLKREGDFDNTLFILTSDHGESLGDHGHLDHYYVLYESLLRVPLIVRYPKVFKSGYREKKTVQTLDLLPSLKQLLNLSELELATMQGYSLPPLENGALARPFTISERFKDLKGLKETYPDTNLDHLKIWELDRKVAIRTDRYKLIYSSDFKSELYDLKEDPNEKNNIINDHKEVADDLLQKLQEWQRSFKSADIGNKEADFDDAVKKRLKALGYLG